MFRLLIRIVDFPLSRLTDLGVWGMGYGVKFGDILLRPMERTVASGSEGDGAG